MTAPFAEGAGTIVVRDRRIVYASAGVAALAGRPAEALAGLGYLEIVAEEERARMAERHERRLRGEPVPAEFETLLAAPDGTRRAVECQVTRDGQDVVIQLRDRSADAARRPRLERLAALGVALAGERSERAVLARARSGLAELGLAAVLLRVEPAGPRVAWAGLPPEGERWFAETLGRPTAGFGARWTRFSRAIWNDGSAFTDEWGKEVSESIAPEHGPAIRAMASALGLSHAAGVRLDERAGPSSYLVIAGPWLRRGDLAAIQLFGAQVAAALDAARTIADLSRHNADLAAIDAIGRLAGEAGALPAFFSRAAAVLENAWGATHVLVHAVGEDGERVRLWPAAPGPDEELLAAAWSAAALDRHPRVVEHPAPLEGVPRTWAVVPLVARAKTVGVLSVASPADAPVVRARLELLTSAGAHLAAAIEADGLLGDLRRRVGELTLLNDLAMASATLDPVLLLDNALRRVCETFAGDAAAAFLREGDRLVLVASRNVPASVTPALAVTLVGETPAGLAVERLAPVIADEPGAFGPHAGPLAEMGIRHAVAIPLLAKSEALGALALGRRPDRAFAPGEVTLLSAIGVQLGVAVENARLFAATRRRLRDMEAVHALALRIFENAPGDVKALLDDGCREAARTLAARGAVVLLLAEDGATLQAAAAHGTPLPAGRVVLPLSRDRMAEDAIRRRAPSQSEDVSRDPRSAMAGLPTVPPLAMLAVPLAARDAVRGVLFVADDAGRRFTDAEVALAQALAAELALGIENAEVYLETRRRAEELGVLQDVGRSLVATLEPAQVLAAGVSNLARIADAPQAFLFLPVAEGGALELHAAAGAPSSLVGTRLALDAPSLVGLAFSTRAPVAVEDAAGEPRAHAPLVALTGARGFLGLPLVVRDRVIGAAVIADPRAPRRFTAAEVERAAAVANQLAVAVENARLYEDLRLRNAELERAQQQIAAQERLAALGELSAIVAHEVRNPLGVIFNSLGTLRRLLRPQGDARMLLDIVGEEADRLNRIVGDLLDFARPSTPVLRPEPLDEVVDEAVAAALAQKPPEIELVRVTDPALGEVPVDARLVRQAVINIAVNAVQAMPRGGRLVVRTSRTAGGALLEIADTGGGIPPEVRPRIFEPFFTTKASGTGLGLAVVKRILDGHGGEVTVSSPAGGGTVFALRFPANMGAG